jgi:hypothetical protein
MNQREKQTRFLRGEKADFPQNFNARCPLRPDEADP